MRESDVQNLIRIELSKYATVFRANVGKVRTIDGRWFDTGLPKGFSDLFGFRHSDGKFFAIEVKNETGKLREEQKQFIAFLKSKNILCGVARNVDDALRIISEV